MKSIRTRLTIAAMVLAIALTVPLSASAQSAPEIYKAKCAGCHGVDGKGDTAPGKALGAHDFASAEVAKMSNEDLVKIVASGKNKMPAYGKTLSDSDIKSLVAFIRDLSKKK